MVLAVCAGQVVYQTEMELRQNEIKTIYNRRIHEQTQSTFLLAVRLLVFRAIYCDGLKHGSLIESKGQY